MFRSDFIAFSGEVETLGKNRYALRASGRNEPSPFASDATPTVVEISAEEYALIQRFDGQHSLADVWQQSQTDESALTRGQLRDFVAELATYGLMHAGRFEPLPPPRQRDVASMRSACKPDHDWPATHSFPPPSVPGTLAQPGVEASFLGLELKGEEHPIRPDLFVALGRMFLWPLNGRLRFLCGLGSLICAFVLVYSQRHAWLQSSIIGMPVWRIALHIGVSLWLVNLLGAAAQAAAISRFAHSKPELYWATGFWRLPLFAVDATRIASHLGRRDRLRIVAANLSGTAHLIFLGVLLWAMTATTLPVLASAASITATAATISLILRLNPLVNREGQQLLTNHLGIMDLQRQAFGALFKQRRPWNTQSQIVPRRWLVAYSALTLVFGIALIILAVWLLGGFLERRFQGAGVVLILSSLGLLVAKQFSRVSVETTSLGEPPRRWRPSKGLIAFVFVLVAVGLIPYPYEPGGGFEVLPVERADVRALTAGDVREVLVREGDTVTAGTAIVRIDDTHPRAQVAAHEAELASLRADLALILKGAKSEEIEVARKRVETATTARNIAEASFRRIGQAYATRSVTAETYDQARGAAEVAAEELAEAKSGLELVQSPAEQERVASLEADIQRVEAELDAARSELAATRVTAPIDGRVVAPRLLFARGEYLNRGDLVATIENTGELLAEVKLPQASIGEISIGSPVNAKLWAYPGISFSGLVRSIAPNAEEGEYGKVVRVQVAFDDVDERLKPGLTGNAKIAAGWEPTGLVFTRAFVRFVMVELWSWIP